MSHVHSEHENAEDVQSMDEHSTDETEQSRVRTLTERVLQSCVTERNNRVAKIESAAKDLDRVIEAIHQLPEDVKCLNKAELDLSKAYIIYHTISTSLIEYLERTRTQESLK